MKILLCKTFVWEKEKIKNFENFFKNQLSWSEESSKKVDDKTLYIELNKEIHVLTVLEKESKNNYPNHKLIPWNISNITEMGFTLMINHPSFQGMVLIPISNIVAVHTISPEKIKSMKDYEIDLKNSQKTKNENLKDDTSTLLQ